DNIAVKRRAYQIAREVAGDANVEDRLLLRVQRERTGDALLQAVIDALATDPVYRDFVISTRRDELPTDRDAIAVEVQDSQVRLYGQANSLSHRRLAEVTVWWVPGTADVENRIRVQPPQRDSDEEITEIVRLVFDKDPTLDAQNIQITTRDRVVTLAGVVNSEAHLHIAEQDCWYIPGVHQVQNQLQIRPRS
ncbi:MAG TPA: BON domain-containing protein, partial [Gammaproteobacteria bacterium]|nr:BON domain-containing protein [Gammaproteobacteria bacterium]